MTDLLTLWSPQPVMLRHEVPWEIDLLPARASDLLMYLTSHESKVIRGFVLPDVQVGDVEPDEETVREMVDKVATTRDEIRARRGMLKGLAMELLTAAILRHLDTPSRVMAWAKHENGQPQRVCACGMP